MKLRLSIKQIRELQDKHGISNLLQPTAEDSAKVAHVDVLADVYYEGSRSWENAPAKESIEEMDPHEILEALKAFLGGGAEGKA